MCSHLIRLTYQGCRNSTGDCHFMLHYSCASEIITLISKQVSSTPACMMQNKITGRLSRAKLKHFTIQLNGQYSGLILPVTTVPFCSCKLTILDDVKIRFSLLLFCPNNIFTDNFTGELVISYCNLISSTTCSYSHVFSLIAMYFH